jgi:hypothetical protein
VIARTSTRLAVYATLLVLVATTFVGSASTGNAQANSRYFPETGKTVTQPFLKYWLDHGGLAQQGYPITDSYDELNDIDGKVYRTQYFERARFEFHPEQQIQFQVLLGLLGTETFKAKYGTTPPPGAPQTVPGNGSRTFPATGKTVMGLFLTYWNSHGGLEQQGFPITEAYNEVNDDDGKTYITQYFERARFEYHPESAQDQFKVLLGLVGREVYNRKLQTPTATPLPTQTPGGPTATTIPTSTATPTLGPSPVANTATPVPPPPPGPYAAVGHINADGTYTEERDMPGFSAGWTHIVSPSTNRLFFYNQNTGVGAVGIVSADGTYSNQRDLPFDPGWTNIVPLGNDRLFFFNRTTSFGSIGHFNADGSWTDESDHSDFDPGWTHVVSPSTNRLFFYKNGGGTICRINADGSYTVERDLPFSAGWTDITPLGNDRLFFYNRNTVPHSSPSVIGHFNADGSWTDESDHPSEAALGWTHLISTSTNRLFFYSFSNGTGKIGRFNPAGSYTNERDISIDRGWTNIVPLGNDRLFFYNYDGR